MQVILALFVIFGVLLAPAQEITIDKMQDLGGGVFAAQDGEHLYLQAPPNVVRLKVQEKLVSIDDPHLATTLSNGIKKIQLPSDQTALSEVTVSVVGPNGIQEEKAVGNIAGKIKFLPGSDIVAVEGEPFFPSFVAHGGFDFEVRVVIGRYDINLLQLKKVQLDNGGVAWVSRGALDLPPGITKITITGRNALGVVSDIVRINVLAKDINKNNP